MIQNFICMYVLYLLCIYFFMKAAQGIKNQKKCKPQTHLCKEHIEHLIRRLKKSNGEKRAPNYILFCLSLILNYILRKKLLITYHGWKNNSPLFSIEKAMLQWSKNTFKMYCKVRIYFCTYYVISKIPFHIYYQLVLQKLNTCKSHTV